MPFDPSKCSSIAQLNTSVMFTSLTHVVHCLQVHYFVIKVTVQTNIISCIEQKVRQRLHKRYAMQDIQWADCKETYFIT